MKSALMILLLLATAAWAQNQGEPRVGYTAGGGDQLQGCLASQAGGYVLSQPNLHRQYRVQGDDAQLKQNVGHQVQLTGHMQSGAASVFHADNVQQLASSCNNRAPQSGAEAMGGKEGNAGDAVPVTTTASVGRPTPGMETEAGEAQKPGGNAQASTAPPQNNEKEGAPKPAEQIGQDRASAERISQAAHQTEVGGYHSGNYGINGNAPDYSQAKGQPAATQENNAPGSAKKTGEAMKGQEANDGFKSKPGVATQAESAQRTTLTGCLHGSENGHEFTLATDDGQQVRLQAPREDLKAHLNHKVRVVGKNTESESPNAMAGKAGAAKAFHVEQVTDLSGACSQ